MIAFFPRTRPLGSDSAFLFGFQMGIINKGMGAFDQKFKVGKSIPLIQS